MYNFHDCEDASWCSAELPALGHILKLINWPPNKQESELGITDVGGW